MNKLGIVLHVSGSRRLILRTKIKVRTGTEVLDEDLRPIGRTCDIFGPVKNPYVSVKPTVNKPESYVGHSIYTT